VTRRLTKIPRYFVAALSIKMLVYASLG
jgi:hypothetical protein